jgi:hypothetical protein
MYASEGSAVIQTVGESRKKGVAADAAACSTVVGPTRPFTRIRGSLHCLQCLSRGLLRALPHGRRVKVYKHRETETATTDREDNEKMEEGPLPLCLYMFSSEATECVHTLTTHPHKLTRRREKEGTLVCILECSLRVVP